MARVNDPSAEPWETGFLHAFRRNNERPSQFKGLIRSHHSLVRQNRALSVQLQSAEKQLIILNHANAGGGGGDAAAVQQVQATMQTKLSALQEELSASYKANAEVVVV